jgi:hypothetical protein
MRARGGFALLRQVSQGANVKVHVLAAQIVAHVTPRARSQQRYAYLARP